MSKKEIGGFFNGKELPSLHRYLDIKIKLIHPNAKIPTKSTENSAGYDVYATEDVELKQLHIGMSLPEGANWTAPYNVGINPPTPVLLKLGFQVEIPIGYEIQIRPRSGLALNYGITCLNSPGTIDSDYRGEVGVILINHGAAPYLIKAGDRIAQMIIAEVPIGKFVIVNELNKTERGKGGYGSSGK